MNEYNSKNRHKYYLKAHLIFVCKYRKPLLVGDIDVDVKTLFSIITVGSKFNIEIMESDNNHIHLLLSYSPDVSITSIGSIPFPKDLDIFLPCESRINP